MREQDVRPDTVTLTLRLRALCALHTPPKRAGRNATEAAEAEAAAGAPPSRLQQAIEALREMERRGGAQAPSVVSYNAVLEGCVQAGAAEEALAVLAMMLGRGAVSPNRNTYALVARFGMESRPRPTAAKGAPKGRGGWERRKKPMRPQRRLVAPRGAVRGFLLDVVRLFEAKGRRLTSEVYLALLRVCEPDSEAAACAVASRRSFDLRRADAAEAARLEFFLFPPPSSEGGEGSRSGQPAAGEATGAAQPSS